MISSLGWMTINVSQMLLREKEYSPLRRKISYCTGVCVCLCVCVSVCVCACVCVCVCALYTYCFLLPLPSPSFVRISFLHTSLSSTSSLFPLLPLLCPPSLLSPPYPPPSFVPSSLSPSSSLLTFHLLSPPPSTLLSALTFLLHPTPPPPSSLPLPSFLLQLSPTEDGHGEEERDDEGAE